LHGGLKAIVQIANGRLIAKNAQPANLLGCEQFQKLARLLLYVLQRLKPHGAVKNEISR